MIEIVGADFEVIKPYFEAANEAAESSLCLRDKCGAVLVDASGLVIASAYNGPPLDDISNRKCLVTDQMVDSLKPKSDRTCCVHAEDRLVRKALRELGHLPDEEMADVLGNSRLYFMRRHPTTGEFSGAGIPYCTLCSRATLDAGIGEFALYSNGMAKVYPTDEYNDVSYDFHLKRKG